MSRWWRAYDEALDDPKLQRMGLELVGAWFNLMCLASRHDGRLPAIDDVAFALRTTKTKAAGIVTRLVGAGLLDESEAGFAPHNWSARQYKSDVSTERVKRSKERSRERSSNVGGTPPEQKQNRTDSEKKDAASAAPASEEADYFRRGKQILGDNAGGLLAQLKAKTGKIALARAALEQSTTKQNAREYLMRVIRGQAATEADQNKKIEEIMRQKGSAVVFATEVPGGIPGVS